MLRKIALLVCLTLTACGDLKLHAGPADESKETIMAIDGVKYISSAIGDGASHETYEQRSYRIGPEARLLMRFESLQSVAGKVQANKPVQIRVILLEGIDAGTARSQLTICPIRRDWNMLASWQRAHPWKGGGWTTAGGDLETEDCASAEPQEAPPATGSSAPCSDSSTLCFGLNSWFNNYVLQRDLNYGVALISKGEQSYQVYGDGSGAKAPRIYWQQ